MKEIKAILQPHVLSRVVKIMQDAAHTGTHGDGLSVVTDLESVVRIRTGEVRSEAL